MTERIKGLRRSLPLLNIYKFLFFFPFLFIVAPSLKLNRAAVFLLNSSSLLLLLLPVVSLLLPTSGQFSFPNVFEGSSNFHHVRVIFRRREEEEEK
jgi:hypothetical protein